MVKISTIVLTFFAFLFNFSQQRKISFLPEEIFGKPSKHGSFKKNRENEERNKFSTFYIDNYKKLPIKRVPEEMIKSNAKENIIHVQRSLNYLRENYRSDSVVFDKELGNRIAEIKKIDKNWNVDHYFQEFYFYEYSIQKREQEEVWNTNFIAKRRQDSIIRDRRNRLIDSIRLVRTQKSDSKKTTKKVVTKK